MERVLTQEEVDALLEGISEGEIETETKQPPEGVRPFDFTRQQRIIKADMPTLDVINEHFSQFFKVSLSMTLNKTVDVSPASVKVTRFGEFMQTLPLPTSLHIYRMNPLRGHILMVIGARLAVSMVELLLGGSVEEHIKLEGKTFTPIENRLIKQIVFKILADLEKAWKPVFPIKIDYLRSEFNPQFARIVMPAELVVITKFSVEIAEIEDSITICIPYSSVEPIREKLCARFQSDQLERDNTWIERLEKEIKETKAEVCVELAKTTLKVKDLLSLKKGDIIKLNKDIKSPLTLKVEGIPKFLGYAGVLKGNKAFKINSEI
ncbi:Flagellar motor switch protein FliM [Candidatus Methanoperedenaceae archaeon GB37]|nr:Flagellar motor switch protein FliM [Candidatus Methanoperedenaceae archaeon GB37]